MTRTRIASIAVAGAIAATGFAAPGASADLNDPACFKAVTKLQAAREQVAALKDQGVRGPELKQAKRRVDAAKRVVNKKCGD